MRRVLISVLILAFAFSMAQPSVAVAQTPSAIDQRPSTSRRPFTFDDMMALKRVGEPAISPNGKWVAFSVGEVSLAENKNTPHLWIVSINGGDEKQITKGAGESRPQWSPDGKLLSYISAQDGQSQVWAIDFDPDSGQPGSEPGKKLTSIATGADGQVWSPDGKWLLFTSGVYADCNDIACSAQRDEERAKSKVKASEFRHLLYRHWNAYLGDKVTHIFIQPSDGSAPPRDLTPGAHDAPPFSLGGSDMYAFSPDSKEVAFTSNIDEVAATSTNNEIFIVPIEGGTPKKISTSPGSDSTPRYSPDGRYIAWLSQITPGYESDRFTLWVYDRANAKEICPLDEHHIEDCRNARDLWHVVTKDFDRWVGTFTWAPDSKRLYFSAEDKGEAPLYVVTAFEYPKTGNEVTEVVRGHNDDVEVAPDGQTLFFSRVSVGSPTEIYSAKFDGCNAEVFASKRQDLICTNLKPVQLTHLNSSLLSQISMQPLEPFWFTGAANKKVEGFLVKPPNFDASKKYPVKFLIHGGPEGAWGDSWSFRWNPELFAANGYVVVMINPTGSTGYGQAFTQAIQADWGGRPYEDLMKGLDYALAHYPFLDSNRMCALGASYGGYMANWLLGHTTRFKCIVSHDGMFNTISAYGSTEELWFPEWEFKGTPWTNRAIYDKWSPSNYVKNFKTPTLVIHGQLDYRLDVSEGFQLFTALQKMKVPSKMLYFPNEGHWVTKPQDSQLWYKTVNDWVDQWTKTP